MADKNKGNEKSADHEKFEIEEMSDSDLDEVAGGSCDSSSCDSGPGAGCGGACSQCEEHQSA